MREIFPKCDLIFMLAGGQSAEDFVIVLHGRRDQADFNSSRVRIIFSHVVEKASNKKVFRQLLKPETKTKINSLP